MNKLDILIKKETNINIKEFYNQCKDDIIKKGVNNFIRMNSNEYGFFCLYDYYKKYHKNLKTSYDICDVCLDKRELHNFSKCNDYLTTCINNLEATILLISKL